MAATIRGTATGVKNGADVTVTLPAATAVGDLVVAFEAVDYGFASNLRPATAWSWTQRAVANDIETNALHGKVFSALAEAAGATVLTFPNAAASQADMAIGVVVLTAGTFDPDSPFEDPEVTYSTSSATAQVAPSSSYAAGDRLHLVAALSRTGTSYTPPTGYTEQVDVASRTYVTVSVASAIIGASGGVEGTTGTRSFSAAASAVWAALSLLVRAAPAITGRNDCPAPRGNTSAWGGSGSSGATVTPNTAVTGMDLATATRVTNGSAAGNARVSAPAAIYSTDQGGRAFAVRMQGRPSAQASCSVEFAFRNASGAAISTITTTATTVAAGAVLAVTAQGTAPAGTYRITATFLARNLAASATLDGTAARYQPDSTSTALAYADGYSSGWRYEGTLGASASSAGTPRQPLAPPARASAASAGAPAVSRKVLWQLDMAQADVVAAGAKASGSQRQRDDASGFNDTTVPWPAVIEAAPDGARSVTFALPANYRRYEAVANVRDWIVGDDIYFAWEFYLDAGFRTDATADQYQVVWQLHAAPSTGSPPVAVEVRGGALRLSGGANRPGASSPGQYAYDLLLLADVQAGRRYRGVTRVVFSDQPYGGRIDVWVDGQPVVVNLAPPCGTVYGTDISTEGGPTYGPKFGLYRRETNAPANTIRHGRHAAGVTYAEVDPITTGVAVQRSIPARAPARGAGAPALTAGPVGRTLVGRASTSSAGRPALTPGPVTAAVPGRASSSTSGRPATTSGPITLAVGSRPSAATAGRPALGVGPVARTVPGRASSSTAGAHTVTVMRFERTIPGRPSAAASGAPTVAAGPVARAVPPRASSAATGRPALTPGPVARAVPPRASSAATGRPTLVAGAIVRALAGTARDRTAGVVVVLVGAVTRTPTSRTSSASTGRPTLNVAVLVVGRPTAATAGRPTLGVGPIVRALEGRASAATAGRPTLLVGAVTRVLEGRGAQRAGGDVELTLGVVVLAPPGRAPDRAGGDVELEVGPIARTVAARDDQRRAGRPGIGLGGITRDLVAAPSRASSGDPALGVGPITRTVRPRAAARTAGRLALLVGAIARDVDGHQRAGRVGRVLLVLGVVTRVVEGAESLAVSGDPTVVRGAAVTIRPGRLTAGDGGPARLVVVDQPTDNGLEVIDGWP